MTLSIIKNRYGKFADEALLYAQPSVTNTYTPEPIGELDPERLIAQGNPNCFRTTAIDASKKLSPKIIVVTDPTLYDNQDVLNELHELRRNGFTIYQYGQNGLEEFSTNPGNFFPNLTCNPKTIIDEVIQQNPKVCADQIFPMNYFGTRRLVGATRGKACADVNDFIKLASNIQNIIKESYCNEPVDVSSSNYKSNRTLFDTFKIRGIFSNSLDDLFLMLDQKSLEELEELKLFIEKVNPIQLVLFLNQCPTLRELSLSDCSLTPEQIEAMNHSLQLNHLEILNLHYNNLSQVDPKTFVPFLNQFPTLRRLYLASCSLTPEQIEALEQRQLLRPRLIIHGINQSTNTVRYNPDYYSPISVDIDTIENPLKIHRPIQYFDNIHPSNYRLEILEARQNSASTPFKIVLANVNPNIEITTTLPKVSELPTAKQNIEVGEITLRPNEWNKLPSLHTKETLKALTLPSNVNYELKYNTKYYFYFIKPTGSSPIPCQFALELPEDYGLNQLPAVDDAEFKTILNQLEEFSGDNNFESFLEVLFQYQQKNGSAKLISFLQQYFENHFSSGQLENIQKSDSTEAKLQAILMQRKGSCRHCAAAFLYVIERLNKIGNRKNKIPVRIIDNDCHRYPEVNLNNYWHKIKIGGFAAQLDSQPAIAPKFKAQLEEPKGYQFTSYSNDFAPWEYPKINGNTLDSILQSTPQKKLFLVKTKEQAEKLYWYLNQKLHKTCFAVNTPETMNVSCALKIERDFSYQVVPGDFASYLQNTISPSLLINWQRFNSREITAVQSCMDDPSPKIGSTILPANTRIIGIMTKAQFQRADDSFTSRVGREGIAEIDCDSLFTSSSLSSDCPMEEGENTLSFIVDPKNWTVNRL